MGDTPTEAVHERAHDDDAPAQLVEAPAGAGPDELLTAALANAQAEFPPIHRGNTATVHPKDGKQGYSYTYADLAAVLAAVRPILGRHGLTVTQHTRERGKLLITELRHVGGGLRDSEVEIGPAPSNPQQYGGALTYLRRYEISALLGIAPEEDRDAQDVEPARGGYGHEPADPVPSWARPVTTDAAKRAFSRDLIRLVGRDQASDLAPKWAQVMGGIPVGVAGIVEALTMILRPETADEAAAAEAARQQQDADAEQPQAAPATDAPAPAGFDPVTQQPIPTPPAPAPEPEPAPAEYPAPAEPLPAAAAELERLEADRRELGLTTTTADKFARLREMGCVCPDPLAKTPTLAEACPFPDHGVPFS